MYEFKTAPFAHQRAWWEKTRDAEVYAILWEQGTGKSKLTIDTAGWLYQTNKIDALVVIAPNGVHRNWVVNEVPTHLPNSIAREAVCWQSSKAKTVGFKKHCAKALDFSGLLVLAMSYDAALTKAGDAILSKVLGQRKCMMVLDESARIKNPKAKRTIRILARGKHAKYRRILTGTPVANSPFDAYTQFAFLSPKIWDEAGCRTYAAFKNHFGIWAERLDPRSGRKFRELVRYKNLEHLRAATAAVSTRVVKSEVLDLPDKLYTKVYFELSAEQAKLYRDMKEGFSLQLAAGEVTAMLAITQLLRFQQIVSGFVATDDNEIVELEENPRLNLLADTVSDLTGKFIIWAKFTAEITRIIERLTKAGIECVRYDGRVSADDRAEAISRFQGGTARAFVANPAAAAEGLTLHAATTVIYYSNSFKLTDRLQSEDRAHRIGQSHPVTYIDIIAADTVDEQIVNALRDKLDIASVVTGDKIREWI